jgi:hypothetical protein
MDAFCCGFNSSPLAFTSEQWQSIHVNRISSAKSSNNKIRTVTFVVHWYATPAAIPPSEADSCSAIKVIPAGKKYTNFKSITEALASSTEMTKM